jgi:hypothetical protein
MPFLNDIEGIDFTDENDLKTKIKTYLQERIKNHIN